MAASQMQWWKSKKDNMTETSTNWNNLAFVWHGTLQNLNIYIYDIGLSVN